MSESFVHLHNHSTYSLLDGASKIEDMVKAVAVKNSPALAITDHGNCYGLINFYKTAQKAGINPILGCLLAGQPIVTDRGIKSVEDIVVGDMVLTHRGRFRKVLSTMTRPYVGSVYSLWPAKSPHPLKVTDEHPILIRTQDKVDWIKPPDILAGRITPGLGLNNWNSYVCLPKLSGTKKESINILDHIGDNFSVSPYGVRKLSKSNKHDSLGNWTISPTLELDEDLAFFLGFYCAEGWVGHKAGTSELDGSFGFSLNFEEKWLVEKVLRLASRLGVDFQIHERGHKGSIDVIACNLPVAHLLASLCGVGAPNKKPPKEVMMSDAITRGAFVDGVLAGDGRKGKNPNLKMTSPHMVWAVRTILADRGQWSTVAPRPGAKAHHLPTYHISISAEAKFRRVIEDDDYLYRPLAKIEVEELETTVFNFEVEEDNSYVSDFILHNCEAYISAGSRFDKAKVKDQAGVEFDPEQKEKPYHHITLLCENNTGYQNLLKISSDAFLNGYYYKPRTDLSVLAEHSDGLIATSGCLGGLVLQQFLRGDYASGKAVAIQLQAIFGKENFFIEMQDHGIPEQRITNPMLLRLAREIGAPLVLTNDSHYIHHDDAQFHDALLCIGTKALVSQKDRFRFQSDQHYLKSAMEMRSISGDWVKEACDNTLLIAERCDVKLKLGQMRLPEFPLPDGFASADDYLSYLAHRGLRDRYSTVTEEITDRLNYELKVISDMGFAGYFLIVWDLARHAKTIDLPMGPGRGSAAGCIVSYLLKITELDPIRYGLVFERFLNPDRISMPDVDVDMSAVRREEMIDYAKQKYGEDHVAQIITFSQIRSRNAIRDTARVMGYEWTFGDKIAKVLPPLVMGRETTLAECFDPNSDGFKKAEELRNMYYASSDVATVIDTARKLEGIHRSDGVHAAAVVISDVPITDVVPVQKKPKTALVTQYDMHGVEDLGLLKMDFLGLNNLDIIASTLAQLKKRGISLDINSIPKDDPETFKLMQRGETIGVFQLESIGMRNLLRRLRPNMFEDIAAVVALYRPGPMGTNMHNDYADRKNGRQASIAFHPDAEEVLGKTYSLMIYQEQVMQLAQIFAGYTLAEADQLRKVMGKKLAAAMEAEGQKFVQGCLNKGYTEELATQLFDSIDYFSGYAFNACLTGDTVIQLGAANQYFDGKITIGELFRRANTVGSGSSGDCLWCGKKAVKKQLCSGCAAWHQKFNSGKITTLSLDNDGRIRPKPIKTIYNNGVKDVWKIKLANGSEITATANHKHLSDHGWITVENLKIGDILITHEGADKTTGMSNFDRRLTSGDRQEFGKVSGAFGNDNYGYVDGGFTEFKENSQKLPAQCANDQSHTGRLEIAHLNGDRKDNQLSNLKRLCVSCHKKHDYAFNGRKKRFDKGHLAGESQIVEIIYAGKQQTYDLEMDDPGHNFIANGIVTHNSHAYSYGFIAYQTAYLKAHYPLEYMAALCSHANPLSRVAQFANEVTRMGFQVLQPSINKSDEKFTIDINDDKRLGVRIGLEIISGIGAAEARKILDERVNGDFTSVYSLVQRTNISSSTLAALANSGALDEFGHTRFGIATTAKDITAAAKKGSKKKSEPLALFDNTDFISLNIPSAEYPLSEFLTLERETTGIYISGHPLNGYIFNTEDTLSDIIESGPGTEITVSCIVSDLEKKFTKAGAAMATCKLSDNTGVLDAVMFSRTYQKMGGLLENNAGFEVQLKCSTDRMQDKTSYIIDCLSPLQPILEPLGPSKEYKIMVPKDFLKSVPDMSNFKNILLRHRGDLEVVIHLAGSSTVNRMKEMFNVAATEELESELTTLFCDFASR